MADDAQHPTIIIKKIQGGHAGHHGGSWKVAFADFAVAMMAFFLIMWLLAASDEVQKKAIADYFSNPGIFKQASSTNPIKMEGATSVSEGVASSIVPKASVGTAEGSIQNEEKDSNKQPAFDDLKFMSSQVSSLLESVARKSGSRPFAVQAVPRGILIEIAETDERPMFAVGSAELTPFYEDVILELAPHLSLLKSHILISGHTDSASYKESSTMNNWYLSALRAEAARRTLVFGGFPESQVLQLIAMADQAVKYDAMPTDRRNRRIEILILSDRSEKVIRREAKHKSRSNVDKAELKSKLPGELIKDVKQEAEHNQYDGTGFGPSEF